MCQCQGPVVKTLFSRCGGVWPVVLNECLDDYVEEVKDDVVIFQQQASCNAQSNANINQFFLLVSKEVVSE